MFYYSHQCEICVLLSIFTDGAGRNLSDEEELFKKLFEDYNPSARPVMDSSHTVTVAIQFSLLHIKDLVLSYDLQTALVEPCPTCYRPH